MKKDKILNQFRSDPRSYLEKMGLQKVRCHSQQTICLCPFHDDHNPSFSINSHSGRWMCFAGCGSGDLFDLYRAMNDESMSFLEILKEMASL